MYFPNAPNCVFSASMAELRIGVAGGGGCRGGGVAGAAAGGGGGVTKLDE